MSPILPLADDAEARHRFLREGWLLCEAAVGEPERAQVLARSRALVARVSEEERLAEAGSWPTDMMGRYQLSRAGAVPFWEEALGEPFQLEPERRLERTARLGHALHLADDWLGRFVHDGPLAQVAQGLCGGPVRPVQSLLMLKNPGSPVRFSYHHDGAYIRSEPESLVVAWLSLDGAPQSRGGLRLIPGSHQRVPPPAVPLDAGVPIDLQAGDAAFWTAGMLHGSPPNTTDQPRTALIAYYVARDATCHIQPCRPGS